MDRQLSVHRPEQSAEFRCHTLPAASSRSCRLPNSFLLLAPECLAEEQIIGILKEQEAGVPVADLCRKHGVSDASIYKWKARFGGMDVSEAKRLRSLEDENTKLKRLLADAMLDNAALKDLVGKEVVTPATKRKAFAHLVDAHGMSERRAYKAIGCCRMTTCCWLSRWSSTSLCRMT
ncbi:transposase [Bradyrhizobium sp. LB7.2]